MNKQQLAQKIWASANQMRSKIEANEYKDYILGFIFYKYLDNLITLHQRQTIVYAVIRSIRKVILAERQYFAPPMVRKSP